VSGGHRDGHHDPGDEAVGHANTHSVAFQGSTNLSGRIGTRLVEGKTRQGGEEFADELQGDPRTRSILA
jgi:hypothetical protein